MRPTRVETQIGTFPERGRLKREVFGRCRSHVSKLEIGSVTLPRGPRGGEKSPEKGST